MINIDNQGRALWSLGQPAQNGFARKGFAQRMGNISENLVYQIYRRAWATPRGRVNYLLTTPGSKLRMRDSFLPLTAPPFEIRSPRCGRLEKFEVTWGGYLPISCGSFYIVAPSPLNNELITRPLAKGPFVVN